MAEVGGWIDGDVDELVARAATGDEPAWQALWAHIEPMLGAIIAKPRFLGPLGQREDDRRNIIVDVMARLRDNNFARLAHFVEARVRNPDLRFKTWLLVVTKRVGIDYMRRHPDYVDRRHEAERSENGAWVEQGTLPSGSKLADERPPVTIRGTARQLLEYAAGAIPDDQRRALEMWAHGESFAQIAAATGLAHARDAERLVRAAIERLRRRFRDHESRA